ncbi:MAG: OmpA family protein [Muribaculaceae bacterium]|nr:OmpA family protein [Muribaculaceae bacterium]MCI9055130.1 OmpA family protein [Muribaculaceae bacterium]
MKKIVLMAAIAATAIAANAQNAIQAPRFSDNWSLGLDGGVTTPMNHHAFFGDMRAIVGLHLDKQITPAFAIGAEGAFGINTSRWYGPQSSTAFDNSYVGVYGAVNLFNLFGGYQCAGRPFDIEAVAGAGWGHYFETRVEDENFFATKVGLNFNFNVSDNFTVSLKPSIVWDMTSNRVSQSSAAYNLNAATFNLMAGVTYHFGGKNFTCVRPYDQAEVDGLNADINALRAAVEAQTVENAALAANNAALAADLAACQSRKPEVVKEVSNHLNSVRYVFFKIGSSKIGNDQMPNVEMIAAYLNNHPNSKVTIKGYASKDGPEELNIRLANQRAEAVKTALMKQYKIPASRIVAEGEGIGNMFEEESWNRVAICILDTNK